MAVGPGKVRTQWTMTGGAKDWVADVSDLLGMRESQLVDRLIRYHAGVLSKEKQRSLEGILKNPGMVGFNDHYENEEV